MLLVCSIATGCVYEIGARLEAWLCLYPVPGALTHHLSTFSFICLTLSCFFPTHSVCALHSSLLTAAEHGAGDHVSSQPLALSLSGMYARCVVSCYPQLSATISIRFLAIEAFKPSPFWTIQCDYSPPNDGESRSSGKLLGGRVRSERECKLHSTTSMAGEFCSASFQWSRGRVFDEQIATVLYEMAVEEGEATVTAVKRAPRTKYKPKPLSTVRC